MRIIGNDQTKTRETSATASGTLPNGKPVVVNSDGTVSAVGTTDQSIGTGVKFETGGATYIAGAYDTTNNKVVIAYRDGNNSSYGTAIVGTVSGSSISFGFPVTIVLV